MVLGLFSQPSPPGHARLAVFCSASHSRSGRQGKISSRLWTFEAPRNLSHSRQRRGPLAQGLRAPPAVLWFRAPTLAQSGCPTGHDRRVVPPPPPPVKQCCRHLQGHSSRRTVGRRRVPTCNPRDQTPWTPYPEPQFGYRCSSQLMTASVWRHVTGP